MDVGGARRPEVGRAEGPRAAQGALNGYRGNPSISESVLDDVVARIDSAFGTLNSCRARRAQALTENDWLMSIRSRIGIPGGTCEFDLPRTTPGSTPARAAPGRPRAAGPPRWCRWPRRCTCCSVCCAIPARRRRSWPAGGQFQQSLPQGRTFQLLRAAARPDAGLVPEISGNRLMVSVRLMRQEADGPPAAGNDDTQLRAHALFLSTSQGREGCAPRVVRCPACGGESVYAPDNRFGRSAASAAKNIDLGAWASESYRIERHDTDDDVDAAPEADD